MVIETELPYKEKVSQLIGWGHWFCFANIILALLVSLRYLLLADAPATFAGESFLVISWLGQFAFIPFAIYLVSLFPLSFIIPSNRTIRFIGAIIGTIGISFFVIDAQVYSQYNLHLNLSLLDVIINQSKEGDNNQLGILMMLVPFVFALQVFLARWCWTNRRRLEKKRIGFPATIVLVSCFMFTHLVFAWADAMEYKPITSQKNNYPLYYPLTARSFLLEQGIFDAYAYEQQLKNQSQEQLESNTKLRYPLSTLEFDKPQRQTNVLFIVAEGLRADEFNPVSMPNTWQLSQRSQRFERHFSGGNTPQIGNFSLLYGMPGVYWPYLNQEKRPSLMLERAQQLGYQLNLFTSLGEDSDSLINAFTRLQKPSPTQSEGGIVGDKRVINEWLQQSKEHQSADQKQTRFDLIYLNGASNFDSLSLNDEIPQPDELLGLYKSAVHQLDQQLADVYQAIEASEKEWLVVFTSDYGIEFNDLGDNVWGSGTSFSRFQTQVPLFVFDRHREPHSYQVLSSHFDVVPTLMENYFGVRSSARNYSSGINLFGNLRHSWVLVSDTQQNAVVQEERITIFNAQGDYLVMDADYQATQLRPRMPILVNVLNEMQRFLPKTKAN
ncbi:DUF3413 domain-containing protein [Alginatibacterium sediminis]|uniref:DUF3413 domain-containing protein n=1 Tax=Alginatibacterium sediminis TaxID=2164068 RepID=A0A420EFR2_9ALTE|nr:DUF3413 domain-containing protein [Alginatibacterium sediminis]RKF19549.1 DUF3413 domain-containing protein [Alginatibacterium sediminis]